ncbi:MAG: penicillin-binding protein 2 [Gammaproteobacteria bacterium]|nr:MAG: penicillin-binding protein 2 [Gammaproteobacteria bacterium]
MLKDVRREAQVFRRRVLQALAAVVLLIGILLARLVYLQIISHQHYSTLSEENRLRIEPLAPPRGLIYSRDGELLAENWPTYVLEITPEAVPDMEQTLERLAGLIRITPQDLEDFRSDLGRKRRFQQVVLRENLTPEEVARFAVNRYQFHGVEVVPRLARHYPAGAPFSHLLGYVGRINERELRELDPGAYAATRQIGKTGVERRYEALLHGQVGYQQVEINAQGRTLRVVSRTPPRAGYNLHLTIDAGLQREAFGALAGRRGAIVALEPESGEVLAMVSAPGFDPNLFARGIDRRSYHLLRDSPDRPLFNRALNGQYPPGSTIKPLLGLAALSLGVRRPQDRSWCPGWFTLPGHSRRYRCWKKTGHGHVDLTSAIVESCDVYFYELAQDLGIDRLEQALRDFGLGSPTGIDLPGESGGLVPSRAWKRRVRNQPWYPGETLIAGIGQGYLLTTPLQLAFATAQLAARGHAALPRVLARAAAPDGSSPEDTPPVPAERHPKARESHWKVVTKAMHEVVQGRRGTARRSGAGTAYAWAGKTGTAQVYGLPQEEAEKVDPEEVAERLRDHALFIAFAPLEHPRIALAIIVENGGSGSATAAPIARRLLDYYLARTEEAGE